MISINFFKSISLVKLLLPALLPSWKFFNYIAPSPRVQYGLLNEEFQMIDNWHEFRPRPHCISHSDMLKRLFWNPQWNESLFIMSCAERIITEVPTHYENEILFRMVQDWHDHKLLHSTKTHHIQFRLLFVERVNNELNYQIAFTSKKIALSIL
ncbi:MAG: hypothetical protein V4629_01560 [Pseudomonadota bacterium]